MREIPFTCPKCRGHKIIETMVDVVVYSDIVVSEHDADGHVGIAHRYGDQTNEDGHVDRYQCGDCGHTIIDHESDFCEMELDADALAKALKALNANGPVDGVTLITHAELVRRFADALDSTEGEALARIWNESSPNRVVYRGDSMFEWVGE